MNTFFSQGTSTNSARLQFPPGFVLGSATAAYQIEGSHDTGGRGPSIWDTFSHTPGRILNGDTGDVADDHYNRLEDDLNLMAALGLRAYRFSISWSRVLPTGAGHLNREGLDFYARLIDGLLARGITPIATLYHWDLPQTLQDVGGWENRDTAYRFADYAALVGSVLGDRVQTWTTLNEPWCSAFLGYGSGSHAPGLANSESALTAAHHLNLGHGLALSELRRVVTRPGTEYSVTLNFHGLKGIDDTSAEAMERIDALAHRSFIDPMLHGRLSNRLVNDTSHLTDWSFVQPDDLKIINQPINVLGVNYYYSNIVKMWDGVSPRITSDNHKPSIGSPWPGSEQVEFVPENGPVTAMGWNIDPDGMERLLVELSEEFPNLPLMITENGAAFPDEVTDGSIHDEQRTAYLGRHFEAALRAIARGVDLRGYLVWSLFDNFEWGWGYARRFGIVYVDYKTQQRIPKDSATWFAQVIASQKDSK